MRLLLGCTEVGLYRPSREQALMLQTGEVKRPGWDLRYNQRTSRHRINGKSKQKQKETAMAGNEDTMADVGMHAPAATLELLGGGYTPGSICAVLTPAIKARLSELAPGDVLLVRADDPSACLDVPAWCNLTGNTLQATSREEDGVFSFYIRKKER